MITLGIAADRVQMGRGERHRLGATVTGPPVDSRLEIRTLNLIHAISYAF
jgi:hypothetical protein